MVKLEIKSGRLTHYKLPLDSAANFLSSNPKTKNFDPEIRELKVYTTPILHGTRIYQIDNEKIVAERVFAIKHTIRSGPIAKKYKSRLPIVLGKHKYFSMEKPAGKEAIYELIPLKAATKYIGNDFLWL